MSCGPQIIDRLPWQGPQWEIIDAAKRKQRLPHALLLTGLPGLGKRTFAKSLAASLLCENEASMPCGTCRTCHLVVAGSHPDLIYLQPIETHTIKANNNVTKSLNG